MSNLKPITLYSHASGPNPWKVNIILEELGLPFNAEFVDMATLHQEPYESTNPNGRVPAINDPNTGITLWESGAIIEYLMNKYDTEERLHYKKEPERFYTQQFLHYQMSGQGPYFGQAAWFTNFHPEKIQGAIDRYMNEIRRVTAVLNRALNNNGGKCLVGNKVTYADLAFVTWYWMVSFIDKSGELEKELHEKNPTWSKWIKELNARPAVQKCFQKRMEMVQGGHK